MELLADIGAEDQLSAARAENAVLQAKVKELTARVQVLSIENESLKVEVEMYRTEYALSKDLSKLGIGGTKQQAGGMLVDGEQDAIENNEEEDWFVKSGNGVYPKSNEVSIGNLHGIANPLCCTLSCDDTILATGGADSYLSLCQWESLDQQQQHNDDDEPSAGLSSSSSSDYCTRIHCEAPVISASFSSVLKNLLAVGCMDGTAKLIEYNASSSSLSGEGSRSYKNCIVGGKSRIRATDPFEHLTSKETSQQDHDMEEDTDPDIITSSSSIQRMNRSINGDDYKLSKHNKYIRTVAWSPNRPMLATASADGTVHVYKIQQERSMMDFEIRCTGITKFSLHLPGSVEAMCFTDDYLLAYARDTPYLSYFDLNDDFKLQKINLNTNSRDIAGAGGFDEHVSFALMDIKIYQNKYIAAATDTSRNMILDLRTGHQVRNLYGHKNDGYSTPKAVWSSNGQYILGNTQDDRCMCVWDVASSQIVDRIEVHSSPIRDMYSSMNSDTIVTTAYDKQTKFWSAATTTTSSTLTAPTAAAAMTTLPTIATTTTDVQPSLSISPAGSSPISINMVTSPMNADDSMQ